MTKPYIPKYETRANYQKVITNEGRIIEAIGTWKTDPRAIENAPQMLSDEDIATILYICKKSRIKKLEVIY